MAAFSRGHRWPLLRDPRVEPACAQFSTSCILQSGHSKWAKIKHDKGAADAKKNVAHTIIADNIAMVSKFGGPDPNTNPRLATVLAAAKKAGLPKAILEAAIARSQGKSSTGAILEYLTIEGILPPAVALIIECETDSKGRTLQNLKHWLKSNGGSASPTRYMFQKKGRISFENDDRNLGIDEVLDDAIEAGAEDVEINEDGSLIIWTEPSKTMSTAEALQSKLELKLQSSGIIWDANKDTRVPMDNKPAVDSLSKAVDYLRTNTDVQTVYANISQGSLQDEEWWQLESKFD